MGPIGRPELLPAVLQALLAAVLVSLMMPPLAGVASVLAAARPSRGEDAAPATVPDPSHRRGAAGAEVLVLAARVENEPEYENDEDNGRPRSDAASPGFSCWPPARDGVSAAVVPRPGPRSLFLLCGRLTC